METNTTPSRHSFGGITNKPLIAFGGLRLWLETEIQIVRLKREAETAFASSRLDCRECLAHAIVVFRRLPSPPHKVGSISLRLVCVVDQTSFPLRAYY